MIFLNSTVKSPSSLSHLQNLSLTAEDDDCTHKCTMGSLLGTVDHFFDRAGRKSAPADHPKRDRPIKTAATDGRAGTGTPAALQP